MYLVGLQGQATSSWPGSSGAPSECSAGTKPSPAGPSNSGSTGAPIRVIIFIEATTYSESVISTPSIGRSAVSGPMQNGMTYIVRPRMHPRYRSVIVVFISAGSHQLLVTPASDSSSEQMNVRSSTRATSSGSEAAQNEFGLAVSRTNVPASTSFVVVRSHSSSEPSHHTTRSGEVSSATSRTQESRRAFVVGASSIPGTVTAVMPPPAWPASPAFGNAAAHPRMRRVSGGFDVVEPYLRGWARPTAQTCRLTHRTDEDNDSARSDRPFRRGRAGGMMVLVAVADRRLFRAPSGYFRATRRSRNAAEPSPGPGGCNR